MPLDDPGPRRARGPWPRGSTPTIADVAALAGVSTSTVSKVINDRHGVSRATGQRVRDAVDLLRFTPSLAATSLRGGSTRVVGLFASDLGPWESEVLRGATRAAGHAGYGLLARVGVGAAHGRHPARSASSMIDGAILVAGATAAGLTDLPLVAVSLRMPGTPGQGDPTRPTPCDDDSLAPYDIGSRAVRRLLSLLPELRT